MRTLLERYTREIASIDTAPVHGKVETVSGLTIEATARGLHVGDLCYIRTREGRRAPVEVVGFRAGRITLMPLTELNGLAPGQWVYPVHAPLTVKVSLALVGRVIDGLGRPIDGGPPIPGGDPVPLTAAAPRPMERRRVTEAISTGIRAIDGCLTIGRGQRVGIMSGSGVGKSKLLGMIARNTNADVNVIALIGERGKEVRDFVDADLGEEGRKRSVVVAATSDEPALVRIKGAHLATAIAEWFRAQGKNVLLMMDSVTRFSMAQREVGLAAGEPPTTKGYPPSVFALLPKLLERAGATQQGCITGLYTVLVEGDDLTDPIADSVRSIVDGHIVLSRRLFARGHYPAIDVQDSISRSMIDVVPEPHLKLAQDLRAVVADYRDAEDLVNIGAYVPGSNSGVDRALKLMPKIDQFLRQGLFEPDELASVESKMKRALA